MYWQSYRGYLQSVAPQPVETLRDAVWQGHVRREGIKVLSEAMAKLEDPSSVATDFIFNVSEELHGLAMNNNSANQDDPFGDALADIAHHGKLVSGAAKQGAYFPADHLNDVYPIPVGGVTVIAARTNVGKSLFSFTLLKETIERGNNVIWVNLDMPKNQVKAKLASCISGVPQDDIQKHGIQSERDRSKVINAYAMLREHCTLLHFPAHTSWDKIKPQVAKAIRKSGATAVFIDHFTQIGRDKAHGQRDDTQFAYISTSIKNLAQSHEVAVCLLVQINRQGASGEPGLHELTSTSALEQDATGVVTMWPEIMQDTHEQTRKTDNLFGGIGKADVTTSDKWKNVDTIRVRIAKSQIGVAGTTADMIRRGPINRFELMERHTREF
jgi:replicative DNA helicase